MIRAWRATDAQVKRDALAFIVMAIAVLVALREVVWYFGASRISFTCAQRDLSGFLRCLPIILVAFSVELNSSSLRKFSLAHRVAGSLGVVLL